MWNLKYDINELIYKTEIDIQNQLVVAKGEGGICSYNLLFSPLLFASLLFTAICKASSDNHSAFLHPVLETPSTTLGE